MKIAVTKESFIKSWNLAERSAASSGTMNIFSAIKVTAEDDEVVLHATDIKTSIICKAAGVSVEEPGSAVIPLKGVTDLFKKAGSAEFSLEISEGRAVMKSGRSRYTFSTYPTEEFPKLPSSESSELFCTVNVGDLMKSIERGSLCSSSGDEYPQYLSSALFELDGAAMKVVSTDKRRLAIASCDTIDAGSAPEGLLLPMKGLRELVRILGMHGADQQIKVSFDDSQAYFVSDEMEFAIRRVDSRFPPYKNILPTDHATRAVIDRNELIAALERVDVVVRDYNKVSVVSFGVDGENTISGKAPEFGEAVESVNCELEGEPITTGLNTRFFLDAAKAIDDKSVMLDFNGRDGHMLARANGSENFLCLIAPVNINEEE